MHSTITLLASYEQIDAVLDVEHSVKLADYANASTSCNRQHQGLTDMYEWKQQPLAGLQHAADMSVEGSEVFVCKPQGTILEFPKLCLVDMAEQHLFVSCISLYLQLDTSFVDAFSLCALRGVGCVPEHSLHRRCT